MMIISSKNWAKDSPDKSAKLDEAPNNYISVKDVKFLKTEFPDKRNYLNKKLAYPYEHFNSIDGSQKPINGSKKDFFIKVKNAWPSDEERDRTKIFIEIFNNKNEEEVTKFCLKSDVVSFTCVIEFFYKSTNQ